MEGYGSYDICRVCGWEHDALQLGNPMPEDVARCITALCHPATYWMTGNTLHVDGGENMVG